MKGKILDSGRRKLGVIMGDDVHTGINTSINIGVIMEKGKIYISGRNCQALILTFKLKIGKI